MFKQITLIGCGLIGSSIAHAVRRHKLAERLHVIERKEVIDRVKKLNLSDHVSDTYETIADADLIIICVPVGAYRDVAIKMAPYIKSGTIITDVGSVKMAAIDALQDFIPDHAYLLPGHPIAGTENSGPEAGFAELFQDRWWLLTPLENTPQDSVEKLKTLYTGFGSKIGIMPPEHHDRVLAMTSHLPHLIAYSIVDTCVKLEASMQQEVIAFSASGFRDFTRIAASDPTMWRDIFLNNRDAVLDGLQNFIDDLTILQTAIKQGDGDTLFDVFTRTRAVRRSIIDQRQHVPEEAKKN